MMAKVKKAEPTMIERSITVVTPTTYAQRVVYEPAKRKAKRNK